MECSRESLLIYHLAMNEQGDTEEFCSKCQDNGAFQPLRNELESLKQKLIDKNITIIQMEAKMTHDMPHGYAHGQLASLRATCDSWQDKYERLLEAHKRLQKVNQGLEDKLLRLVDRSESEKARLSQDTTKLTTALTTAAQAINRLKQENARYQKDLSLAIQFLQCNPSHYASHKLDALPSDLHQKAKSRLAPDAPKNVKTEAKVIRVPIPTFPPTAMVYSVNKCAEEKEDEPVDVVSAAILAAILEERERERSKRHCPTCTCHTGPDREVSSYHNLNGNYEGSPEGFFLPENSRKEVGKSDQLSRSTRDEAPSSSASFDVKAIDVGTQTLPSYIGETGKVTSTCIYCHSMKTLSDISVHSGDLTSSDHSSPGGTYSSHASSTNKKTSPGQNPFKGSLHRKTEDKRIVNGVVSSACPWDWHPESRDSGSPSTPTSLTSTSLSYESEASCFASPQDSPGHVSLHSMNGFKAQDGIVSADSADEGRGSLREECSTVVPRPVNPSKTTKGPPPAISSCLTRDSKEITTEKTCRRGRSGRAICDKEPLLPHKVVPGILPDTNTFTPIHISPSERLDRLSTSDSDDPSTASSGPPWSTDIRPGPRVKATSKKRSATDSGEVLSKTRTNTRTLKEVVLKDTYIGNSTNATEVENLVKELEKSVVISSTYTSSATETTL